MGMDREKIKTVLLSLVSVFMVMVFGYSIFLSSFGQKNKDFLKENEGEIKKHIFNKKVIISRKYKEEGGFKRTSEPLKDDNNGLSVLYVKNGDKLAVLSPKENFFNVFKFDEYKKRTDNIPDTFFFEPESGTILNTLKEMFNEMIDQNWNIGSVLYFKDSESACFKLDKTYEIKCNEKTLSDLLLKSD